jgi:hypothetical protein
MKAAAPIAAMLFLAPAWRPRSAAADLPTGAHPAAEAPRFHRLPGNLVKNAGFEHDWVHRAFAQRRRFLLLQASDMGVGEADGHVDHWRLRGAEPPGCWDTTAARSGSRSVRFDQAGQASQLLRFAGEQYWRAGGAYYAEFLPMEQRLAEQLARRPIVVGAWCRTAGVAAGAEPQLVVTIDSAVRETYESRKAVSRSRTTRAVSFSPGTHDWQYREVRIDPKAAAGAEPHRLGAAPFFVSVALVARGRGGTVWFDDVSCVELPDPAQPNRLANAGFESLDAEGWPAGWSRPVPWTWFRNTYYSWTGWSHQDRRTFRGGAAADRALSFGGNCCLRLTVLPGDNFAVAGAAVTLNQPAPRPIEVRAMVKADNLRTLEIMAQDEGGRWLPQGDFLGDDMEEPGAYNFGSTGCGTYDWSCVRKYFSPRKAVRSLRLFLCVRGFDGRIVGRNLVGTVWLDEVQLFEHGVREDQLPAGSVPRQPQAAEPLFRDFRAVDVDVGDRLWGRNLVRVTMELSGPQAAGVVGRTELEATCVPPGGRASRSVGQTRIIRAPTAAEPRGLAVATAPVDVGALCASWQQQYRLRLALKPPAPEQHRQIGEFLFGTPSSLLEPGASGYYLYPDEQLTVYARLNVARGSFAQLGRCDFVLAGAGKERTIARLSDFSRLPAPQTAPDYIDTRNLVQAGLGSEGLTVHPWDEPVRDLAAGVRLYGKDKLLAQTQPIRFGFVQRPPKPAFPERIEKTGVNDRGLLTVNGEVYFPVFWTPHFGVCPEANWPPTRFGFKAVDLTKIVYSKGRMPDEEVKDTLLARIGEVRDDPKLFQYELGEGEMQLQGPGWQERLEWCKRAIGWIRAADPNHVINGPASWLVGHPDHDTAMQAFVGEWDAIGVEASFEAVPEIRRHARPRRKQRPTAVLVGLETYFYQPGHVLRWRGYRALLNGAAGVGLCPSGMMQSRPDKVNFLRGLNGEFRGLAPILAAEEPRQKLAVGSGLVETTERLLGGRRTVIAVRGRDDAGPIHVRFALPPGTGCSRVKVRFEGRTIQPTQKGFEDEFRRPHTVHVYELEP